MQAAQIDLRGHDVGLEYLNDILQAAKSEIARDGYVSENLRGKISNAFCFWDYWLAETCRCASENVCGPTD